MAKHSARQIVPKDLIEDQKIKEIVSEKLLNQLMNAVKIEAVMGETIVSLEPTMEFPFTELDAVSFVRSVRLTPLVRCRECEHWQTDWEPNYSRGDEYFCAVACKVTGGHFYCADGERKKGGKEDV